MGLWSRVKFVSMPEPEQLGSSRINLTFFVFPGSTSKKSALLATILLASYFSIVFLSNWNLFSFFSYAITFPQELY